MKGYISSSVIGKMKSTGTITLSMLESAASNHLFDDKPERFGITSDEGGVHQVVPQK